MPLILKGNYTGQFGRKNAPQWLTAKDVEKTKFTKNNSGVIILSNTVLRLTSIFWWVIDTSKSF